MEKILVAVDFSPASENAMRYAADLALFTRSTLVLFHVCELPPTFADAPLVNLVSLEQHAWEILNDRRTELALRMEGDGFIECYVDTGDFFKRLEHICELTNPDLVIVGSRGTSKLERFFFGNHSGKAAEKITWPVMAVPLGYSFTPPARICLACDMSDVRETVPAGLISAIVSDFNGVLHILNTGHPGRHRPEIADQAAILESMFKDLRPVFHFTSGHNVDQDIIDFVAENHIDILIVMPKSAPVVNQVLRHHHTRFLVLHCPVPVVSFHK
ncbi:MAG: universal stress protein [Chitinophagaceae bacterium]|nr:MAG: universal stress protein [Chitinophagaceae bacterium]